jgi:hypothetical protein
MIGTIEGTIRKRKINCNYLFTAKSESLLNSTSDVRTGVALMAGVGEGAAESIIEQTPKLALRRSSDFAKEISTLRGIGTVKTVAGVLSKGLGGVSAIEHAGRAYNSFSKGDYVGGAVNTLKTAADVFFIFAKASNQFIFAASIIYTVTDVSTSKD